MPHIARRPLTIVLLLAGVPALLGFSGSGRESFRSALAHLDPSRATRNERSQLESMDPGERLAKASELLELAEGQTTNTKEADQVRRFLVSTLSRLAAEAAGRKDTRSAMAHYEAALTRDPDHPVVHSNLGDLYQESGDWVRAAAHFQSARDHASGAGQKLGFGRKLIAAWLKAGEAGGDHHYASALWEADSMLYEFPDDWVLLYYKGEAHHLRGEADEAVGAWDRLGQLTGVPAWVGKRIDRLRAANAVREEKSFVTDRSQHFRLEFEDGSAPAELSSTILDGFERAWEEVGATFGSFPDHRIFVSIYVASDFDAAVMIPWAGGVHSQNRISLRIHPEHTAERYLDTIFHEYAHHLISLRSNQMPVPSWLNEGLAMLQEPDGRHRAFDRLFRSRLARAGTIPIPFPDISGGFSDLPPDRVRLAYAQSLDVTRYLVERVRFETVLAVIEALGDGTGFPEAFRHVTYITWEDFVAEWIQLRLDEVRPRAEPDAGPGHEGIESTGEAP